MAERAGEAGQATGKTLKRRGILAAAGSVVAGLVAKQAAEPVAAGAGNGTNMQMGLGNAATFSTDHTYVYNPAFVVGPLADKLLEIYNTSPNPGYSVPANSKIAFDAITQGGGTTGITMYGVFGAARSVDGSGGGIAVAGLADITGTTAGNPIMTGVLGQADSVFSTGIKGTSGAGYPMVGSVEGTGSTTNAHAGVLGAGTVGPGVQGQSAHGPGLVGTTFATDGVQPALIGSVQSGGNAIGLRGSIQSGATGLAGVFDGDVTINGALRVYGSPKNAAIKHPTDNTFRLLYCEESPESWFADYGEGTLVANKAEITLDADFAALVHTDAYHVFLTPAGPYHLHVAQKSATGFTVMAMAWATQAGEPKPAEGSGTFSWRVVAKRKDIVGERLAKVAPPPPLKPVAALKVPETPSMQPGAATAKPAPGSPASS